ncbi:unnamed protein product [Rotaria socialis]|uniref:Elongation of very long chain fatty acids protein n=1 Tax=Rotaria socialis TaxID=392032 RepID=A0A818ITU8_9BILA|nr:unnamed protein product [Rotaria socialis]CAF4397731.1 unnamed protein product [Rotaria socialis]
MWHPDDFIFVPGQTPLTSLRFLIFIFIFHFIITCALEIIMTRRAKPIDVRRIQRYNNLLIGIYSAVTFALANILAYRDSRFDSWDRLVCHRPTPKGAYALLWYIFYLSKLWEFLDIYLVILNKTPVLMHFRWHHQTTPSVVLAGLLGDVSYEWPTLVCNSLLHTFMYPHFAGVWNVHRILLVLGASQLLAGLGFSIYALIVGCGGSFYAQIWGLSMCITYTIGYLNEHFHLVDRLRVFISASRNDSKQS